MRGSTMTSTLQRLRSVPSLSRPHFSEDNPYSEALLQTLKYTPAYPSLPFANIASAERWVARFIAWYNGSIATARFAMSRPTSVTTAWSGPSWNVV
jgi:hypothetical protein